MTHSNQSTNPDAPRWRMPAIVGGVLILAAAVGLLLALVLTREPMSASNNPSPSASPIPSVPASPSAEPTPSEEPAPSEAPSAPAEPSDEDDDPYLDPVVADPEGVLPPGGVVRVTADALRVRAEPTRSSDERAMGDRGDLLVVGPTFGWEAFGPAVEDGYTWYPVGVLGFDELPAPGGQPLDFVAVGWVAIGDGDSEWLELLAPRCTDDEPTLQHLSSLTEWERLACYGDRQLAFEGVLGCGACGAFAPGTFTPHWLANPLNYDLISVEPHDYIGPMGLRWSPDGPQRPDPEWPAAPILSVIGHFDDPAAEGCTLDYAREESDAERAVNELFCRSNFVVDSYEVIGRDEDFPNG